MVATVLRVSFSDACVPRGRAHRLRAHLASARGATASMHISQISGCDRRRMSRPMTEQAASAPQPPPHVPNALCATARLCRDGRIASGRRRSANEVMRTTALPRYTLKGSLAAAGGGGASHANPRASPSRGTHRRAPQPPGAVVRSPCNPRTRACAPARGRSATASSWLRWRSAARPASRVRVASHRSWALLRRARWPVGQGRPRRLQAGNGPGDLAPPRANFCLAANSALASVSSASTPSGTAPASAGPSRPPSPPGGGKAKPWA